MRFSFRVKLAAALCAIVLLMGTILTASVSAQPTVNQSAFATNTPVGGGGDVEDADPFATNTPAVTPTPSNTPSPTLTPTSTATATDTPTLTPSPTPTPNGPYNYPDGVSPLTGLPFPNEEAQARRNLIVKISNYPPIVRPQSGINRADVVWEYEVEGGVTRFAAIFRSDSPDHVGPVRSGRLMDLQLAPMYQALLAYSGASEPVQNLLLDAPWALQILSPSIGDNCEEAGFCRFPQDGLAFEHTLYLDTNIAWDRATRRGVNTGYRARGFAFAENPDPDGIPANDVFLDWYGQTDARWQWDAQSNRWVRFTDGVAHFDAADGEQIWADNIVIIEVPHEERPDLFESESRSASQQINMWGTGRAYLLRDGVYYQGFWERRCREAPADITPTATPVPGVTPPCYSEPGDALRIFYSSNLSMMMRPGRTWVEVVRGLGNVTISTELSDMPATMTVLAQSATPTFTMTPDPNATATPASGG